MFSRSRYERRAFPDGCAQRPASRCSGSDCKCDAGGPGGVRETRSETAMVTPLQRAVGDAARKLESAIFRDAACDTPGGDGRSRERLGARLLLASFLLAADDNCAGAEAGIYDHFQPRSFADWWNERGPFSGYGALSLSSSERDAADCADLCVYAAAALGRSCQLWDLRSGHQCSGGSSDRDHWGFAEGSDLGARNQYSGGRGADAAWLFGLADLGTHASFPPGRRHARWVHGRFLFARGGRYSGR